MPKSTYETKLDHFLDAIFQRMTYLSMKEGQLASRARLHPRTVHRINHRQTRLPRLKTVIMLAQAVGMEVTLELREGSRRRSA
jgi:AraC-like DNA-binding protein